MAIVSTTLGKLTYKKSEADIIEALETACKYRTKDYNLNDVPLTLGIKDTDYDFNPHVINGVCNLIMEDWEDEIIDLFIKR